MKKSPPEHVAGTRLRIPVFTRGALFESGVGVHVRMPKGIFVAK